MCAFRSTSRGKLALTVVCLVVACACLAGFIGLRVHCTSRISESLDHQNEQRVNAMKEEAHFPGREGVDHVEGVVEGEGEGGTDGGSGPANDVEGHSAADGLGDGCPTRPTVMQWHCLGVCNVMLVMYYTFLSTSLVGIILLFTICICGRAASEAKSNILPTASEAQRDGEPSGTPQGEMGTDTAPRASANGQMRSVQLDED